MVAGLTGGSSSAIRDVEVQPETGGLFQDSGPTQDNERARTEAYLRGQGPRIRGPLRIPLHASRWPTRRVAYLDMVCPTLRYLLRVFDGWSVPRSQTQLNPWYPNWSFW